MVAIVNNIIKGDKKCINYTGKLFKIWFLSTHLWQKNNSHEISVGSDWYGKSSKPACAKHEGPVNIVWQLHEPSDAQNPFISFMFNCG